MRWGTRHLHACVCETHYYCFGENSPNDIQNSDIKHWRPVELWHIDRLQVQRGAMAKRMEIVEERDRWSRQKTSSLGSAENSVFWVCGSGVYVSQDLEEKLLPWDKDWSVNEREMQGNVWGTKGLDDRWN